MLEMLFTALEYERLRRQQAQTRPIMQWLETVLVEMNNTLPDGDEGSDDSSDDEEPDIHVRMVVGGVHGVQTFEVRGRRDDEEQRTRAENLRLLRESTDIRPKPALAAEESCCISYESLGEIAEWMQCHACHKYMSSNALQDWLGRNWTCPHCRVPWVSYTRFR